MNRYNSTWRKIQFYIMSLWFLLLLISIITFKIIDSKNNFIGWENLLCENIFPIVCMVFAFVGILFMLNLKYQLQGSLNPVCKICHVENSNYEYLTFLTTYIIPLVCFDFNNVKYIIAFILILIITGIIFVKMDLYISNPTLVLLGYKLYKIRLKDYNDVITVISSNKLINGDSIEWIEMDQQCWYVKRCNNEDRKA